MNKHPKRRYGIGTDHKHHSLNLVEEYERLKRRKVVLEYLIQGVSAIVVGILLIMIMLIGY